MPIDVLQLQLCPLYSINSSVSNTKRIHKLPLDLIPCQRNIFSSLARSARVKQLPIPFSVVRVSSKSPPVVRRCYSSVVDQKRKTRLGVCTRDPTHSLSKRSQLNKNRAPERHRVDVKKKKRKRERGGKKRREKREERKKGVGKKKERNQIFRLPRRLSPRRLFSFGEGQKGSVCSSAMLKVTILRGR